MLFWAFANDTQYPTDTKINSKSGFIKFKLGEATKSTSEAQMGVWPSRFHCIKY